MDIKNQQYLEESINDYLSTLNKGENFKYLVTNSKNVTKASKLRTRLCFFF